MFQKEFRIIDKDGTIEWILARSFLISNENGIIKTAGIAENITLRKQAEEEIKNALDKAIELNQLKTRFISTVSHELRTPLATILSSIELLKLYENNLSNQEKKEHFSKIIASIDYLTTLLDDVIIIDKTESGIVKVNYESFDLVELLRNIIEKISLMKSQNIKILLNSTCNSYEVLSDKKLLTQIFNNLITNAVKFSLPKNKVEVNLDIKIQSFTVQIVDHGIGIPNEAQSNIFVPFYRAANVENIQGTGLGLSIAKRWTDLLGGEISFVSKPNKGTVFTITMTNNLIESN
jgi:signal transduction histidine kinase